MMLAPHQSSPVSCSLEPASSAGGDEGNCMGLEDFNEITMTASSQLSFSREDPARSEPTTPVTKRIEAPTATSQQPPEIEIELALFDWHEIVTGYLLGKGGFCCVFTIASFKLDPAVDAQLSESQRKARQEVAENVMMTKGKNREARYAVKTLLPHLQRNPKSFRIAIFDLETETKVLSQLDHRNIIQIRGRSRINAKEVRSRSRAAESNILGSAENNDNGTKDDRYFIILNRVEENLGQLIEKWQEKEQRLNKPVLSGIWLVDKRGNKRKQFLIERLQVALQLASAIEHLHAKRFIYRDLKPSNCGIDSKNSVKLIDFGLARRLPNQLVDEIRGVYKMSGKVGTFRYMPPEVSVGKYYNEKADVYSYAHILWTILSLEKPYPNYSKDMHRSKVHEGGERPPIDYRWPPQIQDLLKESWSSTINERPSMTQVAAVLKQVIFELVSGPQVEATTVTTDLTCGDVTDLLQEVICEISGVTADTASTLHARDSRRSLEPAARKREAHRSKKKLSTPLRASRFWM